MQDGHMMQKRFQSLALLRNGRLYLAEENEKLKGKRTEVEDIVEANEPIYKLNDIFGIKKFYIPSWII
ncbi:hypothetical protein Tcan_18904 [Toxocara canis]|uniref:Uncharacterized protein n=1 Tax=Toxocara canis TaxID=6265 RepID=A0A0B2VV33_TOXCA|nr:hypothetical protein Tcan_18904 [Toxocara canis]